MVVLDASVILGLMRSTPEPRLLAWVDCRVDGAKKRSPGSAGMPGWPSSSPAHGAPLATHAVADFAGIGMKLIVDESHRRMGQVHSRQQACSGQRRVHEGLAAFFRCAPLYGIPSWLRLPY